MKPTQEEITAMCRQIRSEWTVSQRRSSIADHEVAFETDIQDAMGGMENAIQLLRQNTEYYGTVTAEVAEDEDDD